MDTYESYYEQLNHKLASTGGGYDFDAIKRAYDFAFEAHDGQLRESGEMYIAHPVNVAIILADYGLDTDSIIAALLHDVIEDTDVTEEQVRKQYGEEVLLLVDGVTKLGKIPYSSKEEQQVENLRKMLLAMVKDIRVIIIKLADRLHNMRTLASMPEYKRREKALETIEVYAPLAHRLGMDAIKSELEDISIRYLDEVGCAEIERELAALNIKGEHFLDHVIEKVKQRLEEVGIKAQIDSRVKQMYSIYRKMYGQDKQSISEIYDLYAIRVIVDSIADCYSVLGIIHDTYKPVPGRFKDYISTPKPNMYQSLHTTVIGRQGMPFEVQIRTWEMHRTAEYGIAAHWKYKRGKGVADGDDDFESKLAWVRQLLEIQRDTDDAEDFIKTLKIDLFADEVFVFSPKGDVINLPAGANTIDFAYAIHSAVGNRMIGARVNGKIVPIDYQLQNGDIVEIIVSSAEERGPSRDWINMVKTSQARSKIRQWFKKERREENIAQGKYEIDRELRRSRLAMNEETRQEVLTNLARRVHLSNIEELYAAIGYGGLVVSKLLPKLKEEALKIIKPQSPEVQIVDRPRTKKASGGVIVEGMENCLVKFSRCCNPLPYDPIVGFITRGYGVSIHRADCINVKNASQDEENRGRWVNVWWADSVPTSFEVTLNIYAKDRFGLLSDITMTLSGLQMMIHSINARQMKDNIANISLTLDIKDISHLDLILKKLRAIEGVMQVTRGGK